MTEIIPDSLPPGYDPALTPWRPDLAAAHLKPNLPAARYAEGIPRRAGRGIVPIRNRPETGAMQTTELLFGEDFTVYEEADGWAWGQVAADGYVGYCEAYALEPRGPAPTHAVSALRCFHYPAPDMKQPPLKAFSLGARVTVTSTEGRWRAIAGGGYVHETALRPLDQWLSDWAATAERFLGVPYLWGGRSSLGLDCSGLVQVCLAEAGHPCLRDTPMQEGTIGAPVAIDDARMAAAGIEALADHGLRRGDIVFFPGHVGIMIDAQNMVHANATAMCVSIDPLSAVADRVRAAEGVGVSSVARLTAA